MKNFVICLVIMLRVFFIPDCKDCADSGVVVGTLSNGLIIREDGRHGKVRYLPMKDISSSRWFEVNERINFDN